MINVKKDKLSTLCSRIGDGLHGTPEYLEGTEYFFINGNNLVNGKIEINKTTKTITENDYKKHYIELNDNSLLLGINGTLGNMAFYDNEKIMLGKSSAYLNFNSNINSFYYYYFQLNGVQKYFYDVATGSTIKNLSLKSIQDFNVPIPDKKVYEKIVNILFSLDSKIQLNNKINTELENMAKTLYNYWFVQFDFSDENGKPYKTSNGKMIYNEELKSEIPQGWKVEKMSNVIDTDSSGDWGKEEEVGNYTEKVSCIRGADINGLNGSGKLNPPTRFILDKNSHKILKAHDMIVEISGGSPTQSTGRLAFITDATIKRFENPLICSNFCKPVSLKDEKFLYNFVYHWKKMYDNDILFRFEGKTSGIKNLLFDVFTSSCFIVIPKDDILNDFYELMNTIDNKKQINLAENQKLEELRDWLLPMLMNGQVSVK